MANVSCSQGLIMTDPSRVGVKASVFSFAKLAGADPVMGVEMVSTGEVGSVARTFDEALLLSLQSSGIKMPRKGILLSAGRESEKQKFLSVVGVLKDLKVPLYATQGTGVFLSKHGFQVETLAWPGESERDVLKAIREGWVDFVINIPKSAKKSELSHGRQIRQTAVRHGCSLLTDMEKVVALLGSLKAYPQMLVSHQVEPL